MEIIQVTKGNIENEHICCAISDIKGENCVSSKKAWMSQLFADGLVFKKLNVRGKVFIEYIAAEKAWVPILAPDYIWINCLWVSGQYKGKGYGKKLLNTCIEDAKQQEKKGFVTLTSKKKKPFLSDPKFLKANGFISCDDVDPFFELVYLPFDKAFEKPKFSPSVKKPQVKGHGFSIYFTNQCPHTVKYVPLLVGWLTEKGFDVECTKISTMKEGQSAPTPFTTYSLFYQGRLITNEILSEKSLDRILEGLRGL